MLVAPAESERSMYSTWSTSPDITVAQSLTSNVPLVTVSLRPHCTESITKSTSYTIDPLSVSVNGPSSSAAEAVASDDDVDVDVDVPVVLFVSDVEDDVVVVAPLDTVVSVLDEEPISVLDDVELCSVDTIQNVSYVSSSSSYSSSCSYSSSA